MNVTDLFLIRLIATKSALTEELQQKIENEITQYVYPFGCFLAALERMTSNNTFYSDNISYFTTLINQIYLNYYNEQERYILSIFSAARMASFLDNENQNMLTAMKETINLTSDKKEIQYCINTLKYEYTRIIIARTPTATELDQLLVELENTPNIKTSEIMDAIPRS